MRRETIETIEFETIEFNIILWYSVLRIYINSL